MSYRFTILGCGSSPGTPRINGDWGACDPHNSRNRRRRCSLLVERMGPGGTTRVLIDTSPDMRDQLLDAGVGQDGEEFEFQLPSPGPEPDTVIQRKEALERLEEVIDALPPHYKAITLLRHDQQMSYEEIAETLSLPLGTVKARIHRARQQIQQLLAVRSYDI